MSNTTLDGLLVKLREPDLDLRAMAASDLLDLLKKLDISFMKDEGKQCMTALVKLLYDSQSHVQNLGMDCLGQAVCLVDAETAKEAVSSICCEIQQRGTSAETTALSVALRVMSGRISEDADAKKVLGSLAVPIASMLSNSPDMPSDVAVDVFAALSDVLTHAGAQVATDSEVVNQIQEVLLSFISHSNLSVRRRAIAVLGAFVVHVPGEQSEKALGIIFQRYEACTRASEKCILLRVLVTIARQCPERVTKIVPSIIDGEINLTEECDREERMTVLLVFETFVQHCTELVAPRRNEIYTCAVEALKYDPNYNYDDEDDMDTGSEAGDDFGDEYEDDIYEDDEDDTWDVRLSGVKLLAAIARSGLYSPHDIAQHIGTVLIARFREREDVVRAEILATYATVVGALGESAADSASGVAEVLQQQAPEAVTLILAAIKNYPRSTETKQLAFAVFAQLVLAKYDILDGSLSEITPIVTAALSADDTSGTLQTASSSLIKTNLKLDVLEFLRVLVQRSSVSDSAAEFLIATKDGLRENASSKAFQVPSASFTAAAGLVKLLSNAAHQSSMEVAQFVPWAEDMAQCAASLTGTDDQDLRSSVNVFIGTVLQKFGDHISASTAQQLLLILTELKGGIVHAPAVLGAFVQAISKPTALPQEIVVDVAPSVLQVIDPLFRQGSASVVTVALNVVKALAGYGTETLASAGDHILTNIIAIISKSPESPPASALQAFAAVCPTVSEENMRSVTAKLLKLLSATTVYDGQSAEALGELFETVGRSFPGLMDSWKDGIIENWSQTHARYYKQRKDSSNEAIQVPFPTAMLTNAAKSINSLYTGFYEAQGQQWTSEFLESLVFTSPRSTEDIALVCLGLRALGYAASQGWLAQSDQLAVQLDAHIQSKHDDVRDEAAAALGKYVGSYPATFAALFASATASDSEGASASGRLQAVNVAVDQIVGTGHDKTSADAMWAQITAYAQNSQGPLPDVLAQSLATFAVTFPQVFIPALAEHVSSSGDAKIKAFYITAFRTVLADRHLSAECDAELKNVLPQVLASIDDESINIRRLSLLALFTVIQSKAALIKDAVSTIEPALFRQTVVNESLIRIINMGPVKKRIDDGLDARRCAFQCVHMLVRMLPGAANTDLLAESIVRGIADDHDIRLLVLQVIHETVSTQAHMYAERLDEIAASVRKVQATKLSPKAVSQEIEKHHAILKSSVSVLVALEPVAKAATSPSAEFDKLLAEVMDSSNGELSVYYKELHSQG
ncbi:hypothetical protein J3F81_001324 [Coemansia sp. RSA 371]|nr:hypothetical protein J3F81_001324 [Coemansia sp. RSA 371]